MIKISRYTYRLIWYYIFFCVICLGTYGTELTARQIAEAVNQTRMLIQSGEARLLVKIHWSASDSPQGIRRWLEAQIEDLRNRYPPILTHTAQQHFDEDVRDLQYFAEIRGGWEETFESNIAFQIDDNEFKKLPQHYKYRVILTDRNEIDAYSEKGEFSHVGKQKVFVYDGRNLIEEREYRLFPTQVRLSSNPRNLIFFHLELFGSPTYKIPVDKVEFLRREEIDSIQCYVVKFNVEEVFYLCWVAPQLGFSLVRQDMCYFPGKIVESTINKDFRQLSNGKWFPMQVNKTVYKPNGEVSRIQQITVKDLQVNVSFPKDYFSIDFANIQDHSIKIDTLFLSSQLANIKQNDENTKETKKLKCGPLSLLKVCQIYGIESTLSELEELSNFQKTRGVSMRGLYEVAQKKGFNPLGMHLNFNQLREHRMPAILHVHDTHFVVVKDIDEKEVSIYDPSEGDYKLTRKELERIWDGNALLFNPDEGEEKSLVKAEVVDSNAQAHFPKTVHDFGLVDAGTEVEHTFILENRGSSLLKILDIKYTCSCSIAKYPKNVQPEKKAEIKVKLSTSPEQNGKVKRIITVYTSDPKELRTDLTMLAEVQTPIVVRPSHISFGRFQESRLPNRNLEIQISVPNKVEIVKVYSREKNIESKIIEESKELQIYKISVADNMKPGRFKGKLLIDYLSRGKKGQIEVSVGGELLGDVEVKPDRVFFGIVKSQETAKRKVRLFKLVKSEIYISSVNSNTDYLSASIDTIENGSEYELTVSVKPNSPIGEHSAKIEVNTSSSKQPQITITVYWISIK